MLQIKGLLLDLDGTLIETQKANMKAYNVALKEYGLKFEINEFELTNGIDSRHFLANSFPQLTDFDIKKIRKHKASVYPHFFAETHLNTDLLKMIQNTFQIRKLGIVTTGKKINTLEILEFHKVKDKFNFIVTGNDVTNPKPDPEPYLRAIDLASLQPEEIIAFEDSQTGCQSAIAAGLQVIKVSGGFHYEK